MGRGLMGECSLAPELLIDIGRQRNAGDDHCSWSLGVGRDLLFHNTIELAHADPFLRRGEPRRAGHDAAIGGDQYVLNVSRRNIGITELKFVDQIVDLVDELDTVSGGD